MATLTASIREHGVLQPILVTETLDGYQLVAGERRVRAAAAAGLERIPAVVRQLDDQATTRARPHREPAARGPRPDRGRARLPAPDRRVRVQPTSRSPTRVGRARSTVANTLRLLDLAPIVQAAIADRPHQRGPRSRPRRPLGRAPGSRAGHRHRPGPVGPPDRGARPPAARAQVRRTGSPRRRRPPTAIPTSSGSRRTSAARSARRSAWPGRGAAAGS